MSNNFFIVAVGSEKDTILLNEEDPAIKSWWHPEDFEPYKEEKVMFKVGDKIKWKNSVNPLTSKTQEEYGFDGAMFECLMSNNSFIVVGIGSEKDTILLPAIKSWWHPEDFELIEERTYKMGDKFIWGGDTYVLCSVYYNKMALISMKSGNRLAEMQEVKHFNKVTEEEFKKLVGCAVMVRKIEE